MTKVANTAISSYPALVVFHDLLERVRDFRADVRRSREELRTALTEDDRRGKRSPDPRPSSSRGIRRRGSVPTRLH